MSDPSGIRAGKAFVELSANDDKLQDAIKRSQATLKTFAATYTKAMTPTSGLFGAAGG